MAYEDEVLALSPSSYWKLDEASAGGGAADEVGGITGTYDGAGISYSQTKLVPNDTGTSIKLDDTVGGAVNFSDVYDMTGTTAFTALAWGHLETFNAGNGHFLFAKRTSAPSHNGWSFALNPNAITLTASRVIGGSFFEATYEVAEATLEGSVHMYGMVYTGSETYCILDGDRVANTGGSAGGSIAGNSINFTIGKYSDGGGSTWDGWLDEVAIWSGTALSEAQTQALYDAGVGAAEEKQSSYFRRMRSWR